VLSGDFPFWQVFSFGDEALRRVGLFDEALYPAYFEDNDMKRRAEHFGVPIRKMNIAVGHDNSSTIKSDSRLQELNAATFSRNQNYHVGKVERGDYGPGGWDLERRRLNSWDA
jgi:GT2 family glycosyltransferase